MKISIVRDSVTRVLPSGEVIHLSWGTTDITGPRTEFAMPALKASASLVRTACSVLGQQAGKEA